MSSTSTSSYNPTTFQGLRWHTATEAFASGDDSPSNYLKRCLATIEERDPVVKAWVVMNVEGARQAAAASTERWRQGEQLSPIDGMPIGIKDLLETRDMPTQMGCKAYEGHFPKRDNAAVWALRQAGAVVLGKLTTTELGGPEPSVTTNPFNSDHTPGGSSAGSGAAVGAGMVPAAIGTQVGGSMIRPASFNANWALKPSQGGINRGERQATSMSVHGVHANCVEDMWITTLEIAKRAGGDPGMEPVSGPDFTPPAVRPLTLAVLETEGWGELDEASLRSFEGLVEQIESLGVEVLRRASYNPLDRLEQALDGATTLTNTMTAWENHWAHRELVRNQPDGLSERSKGFSIQTAEALGPDGYRELLTKRTSVRQIFSALDTRVDAFIAPATPGPAPVWPGETPEQAATKWPTGNPVFNIPSSLLGAPTVTVPHMAVRGLPFGVQVMGQPGADARVTGIARWLSEETQPVTV